MKTLTVDVKIMTVVVELIVLLLMTMIVSVSVLLIHLHPCVQALAAAGAIIRLLFIVRIVHVKNYLRQPVKVRQSVQASIVQMGVIVAGESAYLTVPVHIIRTA